MFIKKIGFTLAEVLITLGIIGIVAVMTMPTLMNGIAQRTMATQTKHFYSLISQTTKTYMANNSLFSLKDVVDCSLSYNDSVCSADSKTPSVQKMIETTLKVTQKCNNANKCFSKTITWGKKQISPNTIMSDGREVSTYVLLDGYILSIRRWDTGQYIKLLVDINGTKKPNTLGYDVWEMRILNDGSIDTSTNNYPNDCDRNYSACFGEFVKNGFKLKTNKTK